MAVKWVCGFEAKTSHQYINTSLGTRADSSASYCNTQEHSDSLTQHYALAGDFKFLLKTRRLVTGTDFIILNNGIEYAKAEKQKMRFADPSAKTGVRERATTGHLWEGGGFNVTVA